MGDMGQMTHISVVMVIRDGAYISEILDVCEYVCQVCCLMYVTHMTTRTNLH